MSSSAGCQGYLVPILAGYKPRHGRQGPLGREDEAKSMQCVSGKEGKDAREVELVRGFVVPRVLGGQG